ncbi:hypothetical protein HRbin36_00419 [bacterium HR36]|nr:hypothetical protein HRbin36_00419 [bacterium HR36]
MDDEKRRGTVGWALTILRCRLASSPEAIYQSLRRRWERLESGLGEVELLHRRGAVAVPAALGSTVEPEELEELEEAPEAEVVQKDEEVFDQATAARTVGKMREEIATLERLEDYSISSTNISVSTEIATLERLEALA